MIIDEFKRTYLALNKDNIDLLNTLYSDDTTFIDPFNRVDSLNNLKKYFTELYENVHSINFDFIDESSKTNNHYITWKMTLAHPKLNSGKEFIVDGATHLKSDESNKVNYHRDYFDGASMIYEKIPVFGKIIKMIKSRI